VFGEKFSVLANVFPVQFIGKCGYTVQLHLKGRFYLLTKDNANQKLKIKIAIRTNESTHARTQFYQSRKLNNTPVRTCFQPHSTIAREHNCTSFVKPYSLMMDQ
jgi:hypothetical protein